MIRQIGCYSLLINYILYAILSLFTPKVNSYVDFSYYLSSVNIHFPVELDMLIVPVTSSDLS